LQVRDTNKRKPKGSVF